MYIYITCNSAIASPLWSTLIIFISFDLSFDFEDDLIAIYSRYIAIQVIQGSGSILRQTTSYCLHELQSTGRLPQVAEQAWRKNGYAVAIVSGYLRSSNLGMRWKVCLFWVLFPMLRRVFNLLKSVLPVFGARFSLAQGHRGAVDRHGCHEESHSVRQFRRLVLRSIFWLRRPGRVGTDHRM